MRTTKNPDEDGSFKSGILWILHCGRGATFVQNDSAPAQAKGRVGWDGMQTSLGMTGFFNTETIPPSERLLRRR